MSVVRLFILLVAMVGGAGSWERGDRGRKRG
jgi:hypothetical protein